MQARRNAEGKNTQTLCVRKSTAEALMWGLIQVKNIGQKQVSLNTLLKMNNLFRAHENRLEHCCSALLHVITGYIRLNKQ